MNEEKVGILVYIRDEATAALNRIGGGLRGTMSKIGSDIGQGVHTAIGNLEKIGITAGVAVGGFAIAAAKSAMSFQAAMELIRTQAGATQDEVTAMTKGVLELSPQVATGPEALAAGLYHIESAGIRGAKALDVLRTAAQGAKVGNADLESVTNALIAEVNSGIGGVTGMSGAMGVLNAIVGAGNMRMEDLAAAMGTGILSSAKTFGISIQSVGAALADMTNQGVPATDAATRLRMSFSLLGAPTSKAVGELKSIGIGQFDMANAMRGPQGILGALTLLREHLDSSGLSATKQAALISAAFGGGRSSTAIMTLLGSLDKMKTIQEQINKGAWGFGDAWAATQQEVDFKAAQVGAAFDKLKIQLGNALLPAASNILGSLADVLSSPEAAAGMQSFGDALSSAFSKENIANAIAFGREVLPTIAGALQTTFGIAKAAFDLFMSLPGPLKEAAIAGFAVNKLTGGMVTNVLGDVARGVIGGGKGGVGGILGGIGVQHVWVDNMGLGGMGGGLGGAASAAGGAGGLGIAATGAALVGGAVVGGLAGGGIAYGVEHALGAGRAEAAITPGTEQYNYGVNRRNPWANMAGNGGPAFPTGTLHVEDRNAQSATGRLDQRVSTLNAKFEGVARNTAALGGGLQGVRSAVAALQPFLIAIQAAVMSNTAMAGVVAHAQSERQTVVVSPSARQTEAAKTTQASYGPTRVRHLGL